jgi:hypothetical protein
MSSISLKIYERVHELALAITNASEAGDDALYVSRCQTLRAFYDEQTAAGRFHPFLTEATADYTDEPLEAVRLYELALEQSRMFPGEPTHTKLICLAEKLVELGRKEQAEAYLRDGRAEAVRHSDTFWIEEAERLLRELST